MFRTRSFVQQLGLEELAEFESEIRRWGYGQSERLVDWLAGKGVKSLRSAVSRYEVAIRARDGINAMGGSIKAVIGVGNAPLDTLAGLYRRLGEVEYERAVLIIRLQTCLWMRKSTGRIERPFA